MIKIQIHNTVTTESIGKVSGFKPMICETLICNMNPDTFGVFCYDRYKV